MYRFSLLFLKFILFSMVGYVFEMTCCAIIDRKITNRGFFCGPIIPIYGFGSLFLIYLLKPFSYDAKNILTVIFLGMLITGTLEYFTSYFLEKIFHNKWWDYSKEKFNINGRVCLKNLFAFGLGTPVVLYVLNPSISHFLLQAKDSVLIVSACLTFVIFIFDLVYSCLVAYNLRNHIIVVENLKNEKLARLPGMFEKMLKKRIKGFRHYPKRLFKAFPTLFKGNEREFELMKKLEIKEKEKKKKHKKRAKSVK